MYPLIKTGGLADVAGALPAAVARFGVEMHSLLPAYPAVMKSVVDAETIWAEDAYFGGPARILSARVGALRLFLLDAPHLYMRPGSPYTNAAGQDWPDNAQRFAALSFAAGVLGSGGVPGFRPDVVHAHDWQAGLAPAYLALRGGSRPASVMTIHNLAFQGQVPTGLLHELRLPASAYHANGVEYYGAIGMLKAGLRYADRLTTVSPTYAAEICTPEGGMGMDGLLRARANHLVGILNGIDITVWNPETDGLLAETYSRTKRIGRQACKRALQQQFGLQPDAGRLLFGVVSRLSDQKGLDVLLESLPALEADGAQLALLGSGDPVLEAAFMDASKTLPESVGVRLGYDEALAHGMQAGSDAILVPSRFEPCGLTQLCALRYGALPVVSRVGGLADTVIDANAAAVAAGVATGFQFSAVTKDGLSSTIARVARAWRDRRGWMVMQGRAMRSEVGWNVPAAAYAALYREAALDAARQQDARE